MPHRVVHLSQRPSAITVQLHTSGLTVQRLHQLAQPQRLVPLPYAMYSVSIVEVATVGSSFGLQVIAPPASMNT
jgi:hypothetical protein